MIFKPYGYAIWELVQKAMDVEIKAYGVENAYFPMFIPESLLNKEKEHVKGFSPELAVVTIGGGEELEERLIIRPTSETIMYNEYAKWVHSWRDLPILINQWNNVIRWEKRTYLFLRTTEFLWQEGHCAHATHKESMDTVLWAMNMYSKIYRKYFALDGHVGKKSSAEKFAGAVETLSFESLMPDGKALQSCTSHDLGQNFSKPFNISFQDQNGETQFAWQNSWGFSTRSIGGLILAHGDDHGLKLPPKLAPVQVVIISVGKNHIEHCRKLANEFKQNEIRAEVSDENETVGNKIRKAIAQKIPYMLVIGDKEMNSDKLQIRKRGEKETTGFDKNEFIGKIKKLIAEKSNNL